MNRREMLKLGAALAVAPSVPVPVDRWEMRTIVFGPEKVAHARAAPVVTLGYFVMSRQVRVFNYATSTSDPVRSQRLNPVTGEWEEA